MAGKPSKKIYCMDMSRQSKKPCQAKGFPTNSFNEYGVQIYKCRFHGGQNTNFYGFRDRANRGGFNKPGYSDEAKIKSLASLHQFRDKPLEYVRNYYYNKVKHRYNNSGRYSSIYGARAFIRRKNTSVYKKGSDLANQLDQVLSVLKSRGKQRDQS